MDVGGVFRLQNVTLRLQRGQVLVILGASGSGKSVFLESLAGFNRPAAGRIFLDGQEVTAYPPEMRQIGFMFQDYALFPHLTVKDNILFSQRFHKVRRQAAFTPWLPKRPVQGLELKETRLFPASSRDEGAEVVKWLHLEHLLERYPGQLSGGEKQRVALARVLLQQPKLFLFDEPMSALDARTREDLREELRGIFKELNLTAVYVTHDQAEALALADQVCILQNGRVVQAGMKEEAFGRPVDVATARFVGMDNILLGKVSRVELKERDVHSQQEKWMPGKRVDAERSPGLGQTAGRTTEQTAGQTLNLRWEIDVAGLGRFSTYSPETAEFPQGAEEVCLGIRPEDIVIEPCQTSEKYRVPPYLVSPDEGTEPDILPDDKSGDNAFDKDAAFRVEANYMKAVIEDILPWGILYKLHFAGAAGLTALVLKQQVQSLRLKKGAKVWLYFPPESLHLMPLPTKTNDPVS